ncbi:phage tail tip lysozyme [Aureimonas ureilytica]|nr:phage tail tip lysozyme [Aureimonas ureilytica]
MAREVDELAQLESAGIKIAGGYAAALDRIILKYDETAQAAAKAKAAQADMIRQAREDQNAANSKASAGANHDKFSSFMGVRSGTSSSARDSAQVFEEEARAAEKLREELNPLGAAYAKMLQQVGAYEAMARRGTISTDEMSAAVRKAINGFHQLADSEAARETQALAAEQDRAAQAASRHAAMLDNLRASIDPAYASARNMARELSELTMLENAGIRIAGGYATAREKIARKYDAGAQAADKEARAVAQLREELNPLAAAHARLNEKLESYQAMARRGAITSDELALATSKARREFDHSARNLRGVGDEARLSSHQVQNLGYQLNDAATMLLSGSSPFQVLATQGGQVVQALGDGPGGVKGALKVIGDSVLAFGARLGPVGIAIGVLGAAGAVALAMWPKVQDRIDRVNASAEKFANTLRDIRRGNADLADVIEQGVNRSLTMGPDMLRDRLAAEQQRQIDATEQARKGVGQSAFFGVGFNPLNWGKDAIQTLSGGVDVRDLQDLAAEFVNGTKSASEFRQELDRLQATGEVPRYLHGTIDEVTKLTDAAIDAEAKIKQLKDGLDNLRIAKQAADDAEKAGTAYEKFRGAGFDLETLKTERQRINEAFEKFKSTSMGPLNPKDVQRYNEALRQLDVQDERARKGRELDIQQLGARTVAERARIAAERERLNLTIPGINQEKVAADAAAASQMVYAEAAESAAEALRSSKDAYAQAGLDGYAGQIAAINAQYARQIELAQGSEAAVRSLTEARDLDLKALEVGARKSLFDGQEEELRRLQMEAGLIGQNDDVRRKAVVTLQAEAELRRQGIDLNSEWGRTYVTNAQQISDMDDALMKQQKVFDGLKDAAQGFFEALSSGSGIMDALSSTFGRFAQQLASKGFDQVFGGLLGKGGASAPSVAGAITQAASQIPAYGSGMAMERTLAAPVGAVTRTALPPIVTGDGFSPTKAASVARQSVPAQIWDFFAAKGLASHQIAGIMGQAKAESSFNPTAVGDNGQAFGLFQHNDRKQSLFNYIGGRQNLSDVNAQLEFVWKELNTTEGAAYKRLLAARDYFEANEAMISFERPSGYEKGVKNAHNYSGRLAYTKEAYETYSGSVAASPRETQRTIEKATAAGVQKGIESSTYDRPDYDSSSRGSGEGLFGKRGMAGMEVAGAAIGAFSNGYSSGSPLSGGIGGIFSGLGASQSIATAFPSLAGIAGPIGMIGGAALGIIGGIIGARKKREEAHKQAAAQWEQMLPQYRAYQDRMKDGVGPNSGLRSAFAADDQALNDFMKTGGAAWKLGSGNSSAEFWQTGLNRYTYQDRTKAAFRDSFGAAESGLLSGQGLEGPWVKARDAVREAAKAMLTFVDDAKVSFGEGAAEVERAREAGVAQLRSVLRGADKLTSVQSGIQSLEGGAAALRTELVKLGLTSEDVARVVGEDLAAGMGKMRSDFERGIADQVADLNGKGYMSKVRDLIDTFRATQEDAARLGADTSLLPTLFQKQAQAIVDGADLSADGLTELVKVFPQLSGVVRTATTDLDNAVTTAQGNLRTAFERVMSFVDSLRAFKDSIRLDSNLSTLGPQERLLEAQTKFREASEKAAKGDAEAQGKLIELSRGYLDESKSYYASSEAYFAAFDEVQKVLSRTETAAMSELDMAKSQYGALLAIDTSVKSVTEAIAALNAAQAARDAAQVISLQQYVQALNPTANLPAAAQPAPTPAVTSTPAATATAAAGPAMEYRNGLAGRTFSFNGASVWLKQGGTFEEAFNAWSQEYGYYNAGIAPHFMTAWKQAGFVNGGLVGYQDGGLVANGIWNVDSVLARHANGGMVGLAGGEMVIKAPHVTSQTYPILDTINRTGRAPASSGGAARSDRGELAELRALRDDIRKLAETIVASDDRTRQTIGETSEAEQRRGASSDRLAARRATIKAP